jgi:hypothetical protein
VLYRPLHLLLGFEEGVIDHLVRRLPLVGAVSRR